MRVALLQMNARCGQIAQNTPRIIKMIDEAKAAGADVVITPELAITGYFPIVSMRRIDFLGRNLDALDRIREHCDGITAIVGFMRFTPNPRQVFNSAAIIENGRIIDFYDKRELLTPQSDIDFFEVGRFTPGNSSFSLTCFGKTLWLCICNDLSMIGREMHIVRNEADIIVSLNAANCPQSMRLSILRTIANGSNSALLYANLVGQGGDGESLVIDKRGDVVAEASPDGEEVIYYDFAA